MPLAEGETFAGYTIVRLLGAGGWVRSIWPSIPGCPARTPLRFCRRDCQRPEYRAAVQPRGRPGRHAVAPAHRRRARPRRVRRPAVDRDGLRRRHRRRRLLASRYPRACRSSEVAQHRHRGRRARSTMPINAACCTATSNPPTSCSPIHDAGEAANPVGRLRYCPRDRRHQRAYHDQYDGRHGVLRRPRTADGRATRRARRPVRAGRHRLSPADRVRRRSRTPTRRW